MPPIAYLGNRVVSLLEFQEPVRTDYPRGSVAAPRPEPEAVRPCFPPFVFFHLCADEIPVAAAQLAGECAGVGRHARNRAARSGPRRDPPPRSVRPRPEPRQQAPHRPSAPDRPHRPPNNLNCIATMEFCCGEERNVREQFLNRSHLFRSFLDRSLRGVSRMATVHPLPRQVAGCRECLGYDLQGRRRSQGSRTEQV